MPDIPVDPGLGKWQFQKAMVVIKSIKLRQITNWNAHKRTYGVLECIFTAS
jgi:hypothetical protein